VTANIEHCQIL